MLKNLTKKLRNKKGFTLIELIIVIAIIGILAAILIPQFLGFRERASKQAAEALGRNIMTAYEVVSSLDDGVISVAKVANEVKNESDGTLTKPMDKNQDVELTLTINGFKVGYSSSGYKWDIEYDRTAPKSLSVDPRS